MAEITLSISKDTVYREVAKTSEYTGAKMQEDDNAYERIFTTEEDGDMLDLFWSESKTLLCEKLKGVVKSESEVGRTYSITLDVSSAFDAALKDSIQSGLVSFFVKNIAGKWYAFTNKGEAADYLASALEYLDNAAKKVFFKKKPTRPRIV